MEDLGDGFWEHRRPVLLQRVAVGLVSILNCKAYLSQYFSRKKGNNGDCPPD